MKILLEWLKDYVAMEVPVAQLTEDLALVGIPVEAVEEAPNNGGTLIELEISTNRPDLLGYHGVATTRGFPEHAFGHFGFGGSGGWADPSQRLAVALVVNSGVGTPFGDLRIVRIGGAVLDSLRR